MIADFVSAEKGKSRRGIRKGKITRSTYNEAKGMRQVCLIRPIRLAQLSSPDTRLHIVLTWHYSHLPWPGCSSRTGEDNRVRLAEFHIVAAFVGQERLNSWGSLINFTRRKRNYPAMNINLHFLNRLRLLSIIEGTSTLVLFGIAMPLKYLADMPLAVRIVGSLHGLLFTGLVIVLLLAIRRVPISKRLATAGIAAAVFPFGPFIYDRWLNELGKQRTMPEAL
jgi:integral membrane protein